MKSSLAKLYHFQIGSWFFLLIYGIAYLLNDGKIKKPFATMLELQMAFKIIFSY
jgi:hypothetical protein